MPRTMIQRIIWVVIRSSGLVTNIVGAVISWKLFLTADVEKTRRECYLKCRCQPYLFQTKRSFQRPESCSVDEPWIEDHFLDCSKLGFYYFSVFLLLCIGGILITTMEIIQLHRNKGVVPLYLLNKAYSIWIGTEAITLILFFLGFTVTVLLGCGLLENPRRFLVVAVLLLMLWNVICFYPKLEADIPPEVQQQFHEHEEEQQRSYVLLNPSQAIRSTTSPSTAVESSQSAVPEHRPTRVTIRSIPEELHEVLEISPEKRGPIKSILKKKKSQLQELIPIDLGGPSLAETSITIETNVDAENTSVSSDMTRELDPWPVTDQPLGPTAAASSSDPFDEMAPVQQDDDSTGTSKSSIDRFISDPPESVTAQHGFDEHRQ